MKALLIVLLVAIGTLQAEDVYLRNGTVVRNARIIEFTDYGVRLVIQGREHTIPKGKIDRIEGAWDPREPTVIEDRRGRRLTALKPVEVRRPNIALLPVALLALGLSWDYYDEASDLNRALKQLPDGANSGEIKSDRARKVFLGTALLGAGIGGIVYSLIEVPVYPTENGVGLAIHF